MTAKVTIQKDELRPYFVMTDFEQFFDSSFVEIDTDVYEELVEAHQNFCMAQRRLEKLFEKERASRRRSV